MNICKFGGSILNSANNISLLCQAVASLRSEGVVVVVSALSSTTRELEKASMDASVGNIDAALSAIRLIEDRTASLAHEFLGDGPEWAGYCSAAGDIANRATTILRGISATRQRTNKVGHMFRALGEDWALALIGAALRKHSVDSETVDARRVIRTSDHNRAVCVPDFEQTFAAVQAIVAPALQRSGCVLIQGYVGSDNQGETTTMGSESSNLSAALLASCLPADSVTLFTDVPGVMSADPLEADDAQLIESMDYHTAHRLAVHGVKLLFPTMIPLLQNAGIPLVVRSLHRPEGIGTTISSTPAIRSVRCIISQGARIAFNDFASPTTNDERDILLVQSASGNVHIGHCSEIALRDTGDSAISLVTVFHQGIPGADILKQAAERAASGEIAIRGVWTLAPDLCCIAVPEEHQSQIAAHLHGMLIA